MDNRHRTARPGQSSQETAIGLLQTAIQLARKYPRDPMATDLAIRAHRYLATFPVHFVTDYLVQAGADGRPEWHRVDTREWPAWAESLATRQRDEARKHAETHSAWAQVLAAAMEAAPEEFGTDRQGTNLERVLRVIRERQPATIHGFDFTAHLQRQRDWSGKTFGPGARTEGVVDHIRKELAEILANPDDLYEWVDVVILALDGAWRAGYQPAQIAYALEAKQTRNEGRTWPDWRTADPSKAIEHDRSGETDTCGTCGKEIRDDVMTGTACDCSDPLVPGEPAEALEAVQAIAELLGVPCTQDEIEEAIRELQEVANSESSEMAVMRNTEALRTVWLIVREAGGPQGVVLARRALIETDWSRAKLRRDQDLASGGIRYQAELLPEVLDAPEPPDAWTCSCGQCNTGWAKQCGRCDQERPA